MDNEEDIRKAVSKAKKSFWTKKEKRSKFLTRKEARKNARLAKKGNKKGRKTIPCEGEKVGNMKKNDTKKKKKKEKRNKKDEKGLDHRTEIGSQTIAENEEDDKIIAAMEKKLKLKRKKNLPSAFFDDGLDYILEVCDSFMDNKEDDEKELFTRKRGLEMSGSRLGSSKKAKRMTPCESVSSDQDLDLDEVNKNLDTQSSLKSCDESDSEENTSVAGEHNFSDDIDIDGNDDNSDDNTSNNGSNNTRKCKYEEDKEDESLIGSKESSGNEVDPSKKYIPPHLRKSLDSEVHKIQLENIKKQVKGNINRLSEANLPSIARNLEDIYLSNSRNDVNKILIQLVTDACLTQTNMPERLVIEHVMLIAVLNETIGNEVGASLLQALAEKFNRLHHLDGNYTEGKECNNVVLMLAQMYNFKVVDSLLISDIIQELVNKFAEADIEMILQILKTVGAEIRKDDPATLKEIILQIQAKAMTQVATENQSRVRFMLDIITALKNNNLRKIPQYDPDVINHAKKLLRQILKGKDGNSQLHISLNDLLAAKDQGRWWIVGSAWSGNTPNQKSVEGQDLRLTSGEDKLLALARQQRMTTDIKKKIFCLLMSSEDYLDAFDKLLKLNLKEKQAREIIHVLVDCCLQERNYNPFYAYLGQKLCEFDKSHKITFQYSFWDRFKTISTMKKHSRHNLAALMTYLLTSQSISLSVLKVVSFGTIDKDTINFFKDLINKLIFENPERVVRPVFLRIANQPKLSLLREGLKVFLEYFIIPRKDQSNSKEAITGNSQRKGNDDIIEGVLSALDGIE